MEFSGNQVVPSINELRRRISTIEQKTSPKRNLGALTCVPEQELKIRNELEEDVERNLEEEIKDQICHLSLRLSRLYQHRKERTGRARRGHDLRHEKSFCQVNICIKVEGGTKIEIKETKIPESREIKPPHPHQRAASESATSHRVTPLPGKSFDWATTLRSS